MAYEGNVILINGLIPANGQNFPLVKSDHVYVDDDFSLSDYISGVNERFNVLEYNPITIKSFSISPSVIEIGSAVTSIIFNYETSKKPDTLKIDSQFLANPTAKGTNLSYGGFSYTSNHTFTLTATDVGPNDTPGASPSKNATLSFLYKYYYGVSSSEGPYNDEFLRGLSGSQLSASWFTTNKQIRGSVDKGGAISFTVNPNSDQYIYFAVLEDLYKSIPESPVFSVNGFIGGFQQVARFQHTNASGGKGIYTVWRSDNKNLGNTTVLVY